MRSVRWMHRSLCFNGWSNFMERFMSNVVQHLKSSASLLESLDAIKNYRAYITIALGGFAGLMVFAMFAFIGTQFAMNGNPGMASVSGAIGGLLAIVIYWICLLATGFLLMDQAKGNQIRSVGSALMAGLLTLHRFIGLQLLFGLMALAIVIVVSILLFVCKIPGVGPVLYALVFPVSVVVMGIAFFAFVNVFAPLSLPAICDGNNVWQILEKLAALARTNLLPAVVYQILLLLIVALTAFVSFGTLLYGFLPVSGLSTMILPSGGMSGIGGMMGGMMGGLSGAGGEGSGYIMAAGFGGALILLLAAAMPLLTLIMGNCIIYLNFMRDQGTGQLEAAMRSKLDELKEKAAEARRKMAEQSAELTQSADPVKLSCSECNQPVSDDEVFCGNCGNKLK